ncbi:MAG: GreA/GreB family elongation factor [Polyangia bacterium]
MLDKRFLIDQLATRLRDSAELARREGEEAREAAKSMQTEAEKKEDGRAFLELGSLATGQERRAREVTDALRALAQFHNRGLPKLGRKSPVELGAIVDVSVESARGTEERTYFLLPVGAGTELTGPDGDGFLSVITPASPVGRALLGKRAGDSVDVTIGGEAREWTLVEVS